MCYRYAGTFKYKEAEQTCKDLGAELPIARSDKERDDFTATLTSLNLTRTKINLFTVETPNKGLCNKGQSLI